MDAPRSLYLHVPFCERKCFYCAFNSEAGSSSSDVDRYVDAAIHELRGVANDRPLRLETVYVGGGTPTSLDAPNLRRLLGAVREYLDPAVLCEWTVEANPGTVTDARLEALLESGVTRISMGVQSLDPKRLKALGRIHGPEEVAATVGRFHAAGFRNLNLDLIYAQPGQTLADWEADVRGVVALEPEHLSMYALQFEEGTPYGRAHDAGRLRAPAEDDVLAMFRLARSLAREHGFELYEISNFSRPGRRSRHNEAYWRNDPYYGIGPGAYARVGTRRTRNVEDPREYVRRVFDDGTAVDEEDELGPWEDYVETLAVALRTSDGVDLDELERRTGFDAREIHATHLESIVSRGLATLEGPRLSLSETGLWVLDSLLEPFLDRPREDSATRRAITARAR